MIFRQCHNRLLTYELQKLRYALIVMLTILFVQLLIILIYDFHLYTIFVNVITRQLNEKDLSSSYSSHAESFSSKSQKCASIPPNLVGPIVVDKTPQSWRVLEAKLASNLIRGGRWKPRHCVSRDKIAIIIPYRDREIHLKIFLQHMHPFLQKQQLDYGIYVVELAPKTKFNRAMLMNIGFKEASKIYDYQCYIFHDVDLYPEDDRNLYTCPNTPRHMSVAIDKFDYELPYPEIFGGVGAFRTEHFKLVNGFSNKFFGWGGEDDDMYNRIMSKNLKITRYPNEIACYTMMSHERDVANPQRFMMITTGKNRWSVDGINSLLYQLLSIDYWPLYTRIYVNFDVATVLSNDATTVNKSRWPPSPR